nr:uncharacterized protein LOC117987093 [Maniola hyperantus]
MAPIRYSLHYEDYSEHLMSRFGKLLQMQSLVDMTLMCSSHTLRVHKTVLAASSAYFQEVLQKQTGEPLIILKMKFGVLKCLVEFMYCGKTQCLEENLDELVSAAQFLKIKGLSKVTKEGLGINNPGELPVFTPPVVINRPPQSLIDIHSQAQDTTDPKVSTPQQLPPSAPSQPVDSLNRNNNNDMVVRIPFDIEDGSGMNYTDPTRGVRPRRGRPSFKRALGWESGTGIRNAAERALLRREQDSRKAIHQLKHLQTRHNMQDYIDQVTLSQAVNSICNNDNSQSYLNLDSDLMYIDQAIPSNTLNSTTPYTKDTMGNETIISNYTTAVTSTASETSGINSAMSQYVNALKNAGLPTDLPILFESGDGSYINVNEQVLLDMVQSSEIQYEVIEQPNIIEKVADPSEIKSIDELSKSIERGEMLMGPKGFASTNDFEKGRNAHENNPINTSLNTILSDNLESFGGHQSYVVLDHNLQDSNTSITHDNTNDFSCIESDMQFFTKSMSDDVKKYYEEQQLNDARVMDQFCPTSTSLDTSFNMSLLDTKSSHLEDNMSQQYSSLNTDDLKRNEDCYDFSLQLPHSNVFKEDALDCLMSPKQNDNHGNYIEDNLDGGVQERDEIIKGLMNIESKITMEQNEFIDKESDNTMDSVLCEDDKENHSANANTEFSSAYDLKWDISGKENSEINETENNAPGLNKQPQISEPSVDLTKHDELETEKWDSMKYDEGIHKNNEDLTYKSISSTLDENIPFAVGLLPLKSVEPSEDEGLLKRKGSYDNMLDNMDAKCLKRKTKYKKCK